MTRLQHHPRGSDVVAVLGHGCDDTLQPFRTSWLSSFYGPDVSVIAVIVDVIAATIVVTAAGGGGGAAATATAAAAGGGGIVVVFVIVFTFSIAKQLGHTLLTFLTVHHHHPSTHKL